MSRKEELRSAQKNHTGSSWTRDLTSQTPFMEQLSDDKENIRAVPRQDPRNGRNVRSGVKEMISPNRFFPFIQVL